MKDYNEYLNENAEIINYIKDNNLEEDINEANNEAIQISNFEGKQYLHSYRYSTIYDMLKEKNITTMRVGSAAVAITNLLENPYKKEINALVNDYYSMGFNIEL